MLRAVLPVALMLGCPMLSSVLNMAVDDFKICFVLALIREAGGGVGEALYRFLKENVRKFGLPCRFP